MNLLLIYTPCITPRIAYTMQVVFDTLARVPYQITSDATLWQQYEGLKMAYVSPQWAGMPLSSTPFVLFQAVDLLYENKIVPQEMYFNAERQLIFTTHDATSPFFDPFAAIFWCVSRYEEYLPFQPDKYGRFEAQQSFLYQQGVLQQAIVHAYAEFIAQHIQRVFSDFAFQQRTFQIAMTLDIDNAFAYRYKGLKRTLLATAGNCYHRQYQELIQRFLTLLGLIPDKYDSYDWLEAVHALYHITPIYFFLLADYDKFDKNISHENRHFQELIRRLAQSAEVGIHPSFASYEKPEKISIEKKRLEAIVQKPITQSRQHYLRMRLPHTYRQLLAAGITSDYSMGYGSEIGFRAGICVPFFWYDLAAEQATALVIHPFALMDATLHYYHQVAAEQVPAYTLPVVQEVKRYGGVLSCLFHNESVGNQGAWKGWQQVYEYFLTLSL